MFWVSLLIKVVLILKSHIWSRKSAYDQVKMNYWSGTQYHNLNRIRITRLKTFPFLLILFYDSVTYETVKTRLLELEAEVEEPTNYKAHNQIL